MNEDFFISELIRIAPSRGDLQKLNLSTKFVDRILNSHNIRKKNEAIHGVWLIERLLCKYDLTETEIGQIEFLDRPMQLSEFIQFGRYDLFRIVLEKESGRIMLLDEDIDAISQLCADDEACFLKSLIEVEKHFNLRLFNQDLMDDQHFICNAALTISEVAGGNAYLDFYKNLLGCFS